MRPHLRRAVALATSGIVLAASGCSALRKDPVGCRVASGLAGGATGAVAGGVGTHFIDGSPDNLEIGFASAIGFLVGGAVGYGVGYWACPVEEAPPPAPPPPAAAPAPAPKRKIVLRAVDFDFDSAAIRAEARPILAEAAQVLAAETVRVAVEGHTDAVGSDAYNRRLSERRARSVADALVAHGIDEARLAVSGAGETEPVASNDTEEGRAQNRRVELRVLD